MFDTLRRLRDLLTRREKVGLVVLSGIMIVEALLEMVGVAVIPVFITLLADPSQLDESGVLGDLVGFLPVDSVSPTSLIVWSSIALLVLYVAKAGYITLATYWKVRFAYNRVRKLSTRLYRAYLHAPYPFHLRHGTAELFRNVDTECLNLAQKVLLPAVQIVSQTVVLVAVMAVLIVLVPPVAVIWLFGFLIAGLGAAWALQSRSKRLGAKARMQRRQTAKSIYGGLAGAKEIKILQRTGAFADRLAVELTDLFRITRSHEVVRQAIPGAIETLGIAGLLGVTAVLVSQEVSAGQLVAIIGLFAVGLTRLKGAVRLIMTSIHELRHNSTSLDVVHEALLELGSIPLAERGPDSPATGFSKELSLQSVSFMYPDGPDFAVDGIDLVIHRGEAIGLIGPSGVGKSTLLDLMMGVLEPTSGDILADGVSIFDDLAGWQGTLGYVPQDLFVLDATIKENVALGLPHEEIDEANVTRSLMAADLGTLLSRLPAGVETVVGERGARLSGGERQRLVIARALYNDPDLLMMDEATASLDNTTEAAVVAAIEQLKGDRTIVMIAHRLSTVRQCDRLVFMKDGRIDAVGTYDDLLAGHQEFRRMATA